MSVFEDQGLLLRALQKGEEEAFAYLFDRYYESLFSYAARVVRETEVARDLVQDTFCRLFENHEGLDIHISIQAYLYKSVYNSCLDIIRHRRVVYDYEDRELTDFYFKKVVQTPEAEIVLRGEDIRAALWKEIDKLPDRCREIFVLSKMEDLSNKEIADRLAISVNTVEAQMTKALSRLRKELEWLLCLLFV